MTPASSYSTPFTVFLPEKATRALNGALARFRALRMAKDLVHLVPSEFYGALGEFFGFQAVGGGEGWEVVALVDLEGVPDEDPVAGVPGIIRALID